MKKIVLTLVAVVFGVSVGVAQSGPQNQILATEKYKVNTLSENSASDQDGEEDQHTISLWELPEMVLEQFKYSEFAGHTIISVREVEAPLQAAEEESATAYELILQEVNTTTAAEPQLLLRYNEWGEVVLQKEVGYLAQEGR